MSMRPISTDTARRLAITKQYLTPHSANLLDVIRGLGCVQLDPIRAVERTHWLVLWSRLGEFDRADFETVMWQDRSLFEYWAHAASIVLTEDYPVHAWEMNHWRDPQGKSAWAKRQREMITQHADLRSHILDRIRTEGPLASREFKDERKGDINYNGWSSGRIVPRMFDHLWSAGYLLPAGREGNQRVWDLTERVLPDWTPQGTWTDTQITTYAAQKAIKALGIATSKQIKQHYTRGRYPNLTQVLKQLEKDGIIQQVQPLNADDSPLWPQTSYIHTDDLPLLDRIAAGEWSPRTVLLSPFDNLICGRGRTERLWDFEFRIEIYVPAAKRQYGYYVLPILHGDRLIGRISPKMDRDTGTLHIQAIYREAHATDDSSTTTAIRESIESLARFLDAERIAYSDQIPVNWRAIAAD